MCAHCVEIDDRCISCLCRTCVYTNDCVLPVGGCSNDCDLENNHYWRTPACWKYEEKVDIETENKNGEN